MTPGIWRRIYFTFLLIFIFLLVAYHPDDNETIVVLLSGLSLAFVGSIL